MTKIIRKILKEEANKSRMQRWVEFLLDGHIFDELVFLPSYNVWFYTASQFLDEYGLETILDVITKEDMSSFGYIQNEDGEWYNPETGIHEEDDVFLTELTYDYIDLLVEKGELIEGEYDDFGESVDGWSQKYPTFYVGYKSISNAGLYKRNIFKQKYDQTSNITVYDITVWYNRGFDSITHLPLDKTIKVVRMFEQTVEDEVEKRVRNNPQEFFSKYTVK